LEKGQKVMAVYVISDVAPAASQDEEAWKAYVQRAPATIEKYGGRYLARGGAVQIMEGSWSPHAIVLVEFPDSAAVARWYASPEYAEALKVRGTALRRNLICVEGAIDASAAELLGSKFIRSPD
jgi:uncharacterized protein (DUF1330 family)